MIVHEFCFNSKDNTFIWMRYYFEEMPIERS